MVASLIFIRSDFEKLLGRFIVALGSYKSFENLTASTDKQIRMRRAYLLSDLQYRVCNSPICEDALRLVRHYLCKNYFR